MSRKIFTPINQLKLTDVTVVRLRKCGKRFEVACYTNKVIPWRENILKDLDEVLQVVIVFTNVSKGEFAKNGDLQKAFATTNQNVICKEILKNGEIQISHKERQTQFESMFKQVATRIAKMAVNPNTKRPYTVSMIEKCLKEIHYAVKPNQTAKQQAVEAIKLLKQVIDIDRMKILMKVIADKKTVVELEEKMSKFCETLIVVDVVENGSKSFITFKIEPGILNEINDFVKKETNGKCFAELLSFHEVLAGDENLSN